MQGRGDEARVVAAFERYVVADGWRLVREPNGWADVVAVRGSERLVGEAKGNTGPSAGLDTDTMFGQLLRRMGDEAVTNWAVVVPTAVLPKVLRVPEKVLDRLGIEVYEVTESNDVRRVR
jgi:hypothetical protein